MISFGTTVFEVFFICAKIEPSFFWLRMRFISVVAESKRFMPGQYIPFSLLLSETESSWASLLSGEVKVDLERLA